MVREGTLVASTVALLERQLQRSSLSGGAEQAGGPRGASHSASRSMSSTDSGKDDHSLSLSPSTSPSPSLSDREHLHPGDESTVCCRDDFHWEAGDRSGKRSSREEEKERQREKSREPHDESPAAGVVAQRQERRERERQERRRRSSQSLERAGSSGRRRERREERRERCRSVHVPRGQPECCRPWLSHVQTPLPPDFLPYHYCPSIPCDYLYRCVKPSSETQEQLRRLESERESLGLQVAVLTDQVDAQAEKIQDLERTIDAQKRQLSVSDDILQREMLTRSSLETQKLELLAVVSELKRHETLLERECLELRERLAEERKRNKPPLAPRSHLYPVSTSTPIALDKARGVPGTPSPASLTSSPRKDYELSPASQRTSGGGVGAAGYRSLPRDSVSSAGLTEHVLRRAVVFADTEPSVINERETATDTDSYTHQPTSQIAPKGIRKIFGKMKRSGSGNLDEIPADEPFTRGGVRSTAGPRLCGNSSTNPRNEIPFSEWSVDYICDWLKEMGLESCVGEARRWIKSGSSLLTATPQEIDKELNIKNGLLRKKLHLALEVERGGGGDDLLTSSSRLEAGWVLRWLDDIGLPQYKAGFMSARVDGRLLHRLTLDDLHSLHISLALHVASIRTGIQVLRKEKFDPHCLVRRSDPEVEERVELWTNHRVMEWLRAIDLAEYAPNLRGSGVHGGLMIHEERFNDILLASLLSIPAEKTLLRRHLSTRFKELIGAEVMAKKREAESALGYVPLTVTTKAKIPKKSQFTLKRKKSKYDLDYGELVCPLDSSRSSQSTGENSPNLSKSPSHPVAASPDRAILTSQV